MTKRKSIPARDTVKYIQTDISTYFKGKCKISVSTKSCSNGKENSEEIIKRTKRPIQPIPSDEDTELVTSSDDSEPVVRDRRRSAKPLSDDEPEPNMLPEAANSILRECQLPYALSIFNDSDSDDSDVTYCSAVQPTPPIQNNNVDYNERLVENSSVTSSKGSGKRSSKSVDYSGDNDDIEHTPNKVKRAERSHPVTSENIVRKVIRKQLFQPEVEQNGSALSASPEKCKPQKLQSPGLISEIPSTSKRPPILLSDIPSTSKRPFPETSSVHRRTRISVSKKSKPHEQNSDSDANSSSSNEEFVSTSGSITKQPTPASSSKITPNKDITPNAKQTAKENKTIPSTTKKINVIENITLRESSVRQNSSSTVGQEELALIKKIVTFICEHNHLQTMLTRQETLLLNQFFKVPKVSYIFVCIQLFLMNQKWHNVFHLKKTLHLNMSGPEVKEMCEYLNTNGFANTDYSSEQCEYLLNHLHQQYVKEICEYLKMKLTSFKKADMIQQLIQHYKIYPSGQIIYKSTEEILKNKIKDKMGLCIKLNPNFYNTLNKVHMLYSFTNNFQNVQKLHNYIQEIKNEDVFIPEYQINKDFQLFRSLDEFTCFATAYQLNQTLIEVCKKKEIVRIFELSTHVYMELKTILESVQDERPTYLQQFTAGFKYTVALSLGIKHLAKDYPQEVETWLLFLLNQKRYCQRDRGSWYDALIELQYFNLKKTEVGINTLIRALSDEGLSEIEMHELSDRAEMIKQNKIHKLTKLQGDNISSKQIKPVDEVNLLKIQVYKKQSTITEKCGKYLKKSKSKEDMLNIQQEALKHYSPKYFKNGFLDSENNLLVTIFYVLFWDIIYESNVPGAFINEVQYVPLDILTKDFYINRQDWINRRLDEIKYEWPLGQLEQFTCDQWENHKYQKSYINDEVVDDGKDLYNIILCIGRVKLTRILEHIAKDIETYRTGIPDLFLWNVNQKRCKFVQVRGERDRLTIKQKLWLNFLHSIGAEVEVCIVQIVGPGIGTGIKLQKIKQAKKEEKKCLNNSISAKSFIL